MDDVPFREAKLALLERQILKWGEKTIDLNAEISQLQYRRDRCQEQWDRYQKAWEDMFDETNAVEERTELA